MLGGREPSDDHARAEVRSRALDYRLFIEVTLVGFAGIRDRDRRVSSGGVRVLDPRRRSGAAVDRVSSDLSLEIAWTLGPGADPADDLDSDDSHDFPLAAEQSRPRARSRSKSSRINGGGSFDYHDGAKVVTATNCISPSTGRFGCTRIGRRHPQLLGAATRRQARRGARPNQRADLRRDRTRECIRDSAPSSAACRTPTCAFGRFRRVAATISRSGNERNSQARPRLRRAINPAASGRRKGFRRQSMHHLPHDPGHLERIHRARPDAFRQPHHDRRRGVLQNTPENVAQWIEDPAGNQAGREHAAAAAAGPKLNDLVAYLESLK